MIDKKDYIRSLEDIGRCLQVMIKNRTKKNVKFIITKGSKYRSMYISFYRSPHVYQFYIEDRHGRYMVYLLKNDKVVRQDYIKNNELIDKFYQKIQHFFSIIN